jgi:hypothetical protein
VDWVTIGIRREVSAASVSSSFVFIRLPHVRHWYLLRRCSFWFDGGGGGIR